MPFHSGAEILIAELERLNVTILPGIPGGSILPVYDALFDSPIHHVLGRHEQGVGFIAQGMARATGKAAACVTTSGPGVTNLLTAIADADADSIPLVAIAGQVPCAQIGTNAFQEVDLDGMAMPIAKHVFQPHCPEELAEQLLEAFALAESGRKGPVLIDLPKDVQMARTFIERLPEPLAPSAPPTPSAKALHEAIALMNTAQRPLVYLGGGANHPDAAAACEALARDWDAPIALSLMGLGAVAVEHPLNLGMLGMHGAVTANRYVAEADVIVALGTRFGDRTTGRAGTQCPQARVIHVDIDPSEHDKLRRADIPLIGDVTDVANRLRAGIIPNHARDATAWVKAAVAQDRNRLPAPDPFNSRGILTYLSRALGNDAFIVTDVGQHQMRVAQSYPFSTPQRWLTSGGLGTMGFGVPAALGAALARPEHPVVCFTGDGSLLMNVQELATVVEEQANVIIVVMDNSSLGLVGQQQRLFFRNRRCGCDYRRPVDVCAIARAFGLDACDLERDDPERALSHHRRHPGPLLLRLPVEADELVFPMVPPGAANTDALVGNTDDASSPLERAAS